MTTTTTYWRCLGIPPNTPPCDEGGVYEQALTGGAAERHTQQTGHGTTTSLHPIATKETT